jgi:hypothetical protein
MGQQIHPRRSGSPQNPGRPIVRNQLPAGVPPSAGSHDVKAGVDGERLDDVEWREHSRLDTEVGAAQA